MYTYMSDTYQHYRDCICVYVYIYIHFAQQGCKTRTGACSQSHVALTATSLKLLTSSSASSVDGCRGIMAGLRARLGIHSRMPCRYTVLGYQEAPLESCG